MMTPQVLQIASPKDSLARLGIVTNGVVMVNIVFRVYVADCRRAPVRIQGFPYLFLFHGLLQLLFGSHIHLPCAMNLGTPVFKRNSKNSALRSSLYGNPSRPTSL